MDSLPLELVSQILTHLPPTDYKSARLTCHAFNDVLAKSTFSVLATFIDPTTAKSTIERIASDLTRRPKAIWSPRLLRPKGPPRRRELPLRHAPGAARNGLSVHVALLLESVVCGWRVERQRRLGG
ncbi:uncharacterized protein TrAtP1_000167 [Trichoderma atroviride]|uniref:uncharacterized protein n=1 Tax=Hypocrea atroviridis TaxID=63577 RepID=UPI003319FA6D|nr:hypothetical protein TrAtP1_000167 [Trichoderma atroviride]